MPTTVVLELMRQSKPVRGKIAPTGPDKSGQAVKRGKKWNGDLRSLRITLGSLGSLNGLDCIGHS